MKKILSMLLISVLTLSSFFVSAKAMGNSISSFKVSTIDHYLDPSRQTPPEFTVTVPSAVSGGTLVAVFYTEEQITSIKTFDISTSATIEKITFETTKTSDDGLPRTPDKIRFFTLNGSNMKPLAYSTDNALTSEVVSEANKLIVSYILDYLLGIGVKKNIISFMEGQFDDTRHDKVLLLLETMAKCAEDAYNKKDTQLLTGEYGRRAYYDEIYEVITLLKQDSAQMEELKSVYSNLSGMSDSRGKLSYQVINRLLDFLWIDKDELLK